MHRGDGPAAPIRDQYRRAIRDPYGQNLIGPPRHQRVRFHTILKTNPISILNRAAMDLMHPAANIFLATDRRLQSPIILLNPSVIILPIATAGISQIQRIKRRFADPTDSCAECMGNADLIQQR